MQKLNLKMALFLVDALTMSIVSLYDFFTFITLCHRTQISEYEYVSHYFMNNIPIFVYIYFISPSFLTDRLNAKIKKKS